MTALQRPSLPLLECLFLTGTIFSCSSTLDLLFSLTLDFSDLVSTTSFRGAAWDDDEDDRFLAALLSAFVSSVCRALPF